MRYIKPDEHCLSATEISELFEAETGVYLHPTNVGNAAKKLDLDFIEVEVEAPAERPWQKMQKRYSELDLSKIFELLQVLVDRRSKFEFEDQV